MQKGSKVKVKLVRVEGAAAIVEYRSDNRIKRVIVPNSEVQAGQVSQEVLDLGIPYGGIELGDYLPEQLVINTSDLQNLLRERGVWDYEDFFREPQVIVGCLQKLYGLGVTTIQNAIAEAGYNDNDL